jgi:hypothetical protein
MPLEQVRPSDYGGQTQLKWCSCCGWYDRVGVVGGCNNDNGDVIKGVACDSGGSVKFMCHLDIIDWGGFPSSFVSALSLKKLNGQVEFGPGHLKKVS